MMAYSIARVLGKEEEETIFGGKFCTYLMMGSSEFHSCFHHTKENQTFEKTIQPVGLIMLSSQLVIVLARLQNRENQMVSIFFFYLRQGKKKNLPTKILHPVITELDFNLNPFPTIVSVVCKWLNVVEGGREGAEGEELQGAAVTFPRNKLLGHRRVLMI